MMWYFTYVFFLKWIVVNKLINTIRMMQSTENFKPSFVTRNVNLRFGRSVYRWFPDIKLLWLEPLLLKVSACQIWHRSAYDGGVQRPEKWRATTLCYMRGVSWGWLRFCALLSEKKQFTSEWCIYNVKPVIQMACVGIIIICNKFPNMF